MCIPVSRIIDKLDLLFAQKDMDGAVRLLAYWRAESQRLGDRSGELTVCNEQIGLFRKLARREEALSAVNDALTLAQELYSSPTVTLGTTLINAATAMKAFGCAEESLVLFEEAQEILEALLPAEDRRLGGLYNNMALTLCDCGDHARAEAHFQKALAVMSCQPDGEADAAITQCNLADLCARSGRMTEVASRLAEAKRLLLSEHLPHDAYFSYVCEKCAPIFGQYGDPETQALLDTLAR